MNIRRFVAIAAFCALSGDFTSAQTPLGTSFSYQGRLNQTGQPFTGSVDLQFDLYDAEIGGNLLGAQLVPGVTVVEGLFTIVLNTVGEFGAAFTGNRSWLEISVDGVLLVPRQELTGVPNALFALNSSMAATATDSTLLSGQTASYYQDAGNISTGILAAYFGGTGVDASSASLGSMLYSDGLGGWSVLPVGNDTQVLTVAGGMPIWGDAGGFTLPYSGGVDVANPDAVFKITNSGTGWALWGQSDGTPLAGLASIAVRGLATATTGFAYGGFFECTSPDGRAVFGSNTSTTGPAIGGRFRTDSNSGNAVYATAFATSGTTNGVIGQNDSTSGRGVMGWSTPINGDTIGVLGQSDSTRGTGVVGLAPTSSTVVNYGGRFESAGVFSGRGVYGRAPYHGVEGSADAVGVYGMSTGLAGSFGVYASGNMGASGVKPFRIDHPDDPVNKYLLHYAAESPEVINFYRGTVILNEAGEAVVELPHYFAKINVAPTYQLTAVGAPMPMLHVSEKINASALTSGANAGPGQSAPKCSFRIAGGVAGGEVSWRVEAVRNDAWVRQRGAPVEVDKGVRDRGTYQHPELYGQPREKGINYETSHSLLESIGAANRTSPDVTPR